MYSVHIVKSTKVDLSDFDVFASASASIVSWPLRKRLIFHHGYLYCCYNVTTDFSVVVLAFNGWGQVDIGA